MSQTAQPLKNVETCLHGHGILCGLRVQLDADCGIRVDGGTVLSTEGRLFHAQGGHFKYYRLDKNRPESVNMLKQMGIPASEAFELAASYINDQSTDSLNQQWQSDKPDALFLDDKIVLLFCNEQNGAATEHYWLVSWHFLAEKYKLEADINEAARSKAPALRSGLFPNQKAKTVWDTEKIDMALRKQRRLPTIPVRRFGYYSLAVKDSVIARDADHPDTWQSRFDNLVNPFETLGASSPFNKIFFEYKELIEDTIGRLVPAMEMLHQYFGALLTHKGDEFLAKYRDLLEEKWLHFLEKGKHYYYIQYFYDWLRDLVQTWHELRDLLDDFRFVCCENLPATQQGKSALTVLLGPVAGGKTSYKPLIFREIYTAPLFTGDKSETLRKIRLLHWRMLMQIRTFDLPFLHLDEVVTRKFSYTTNPDEEYDSTNFWESTDVDTRPDPEKKVVDLEDLPVKATPDRDIYMPLQDRAIPYYYPLNADNPYSIHRFWNPHCTLMERCDELLSYNAFSAQWSYSTLESVRSPLLFDLKPFSFYRIEGHIGKKFIPSADNNYNVFLQFSELRLKFNLCFDVVLVDLNLFNPENWYMLTGMEHVSGVAPGQTLLLFCISQPENLDIEECKADKTPEIESNTIVADFTLPYRLSCCSVPPTGVSIFEIKKPVTTTLDWKDVKPASGVKKINLPGKNTKTAPK